MSAGSFSWGVQVTDANGVSTTGTLTLTINAAPLVITTTTLPVGQVGVPYSATLSATGGVTPYTWSVVSGSLPQGLTMDPHGVISGTPT